jgi:8-oxo-dGTP pyrophosphatase MutT (NUDIX family)
MKDWLNIMRRLNENKNAKVVTFDFDNTIVKSFENNRDGQEIEYQYGGLNKKIIELIKKFKQSGATVLVVTARNVDLEVPESSVNTALKQLKLNVDGVFYTNGQPKAQKLFELGSSLHYDDDPKEHEAIKAYANLHKNFDISVKYPDDLLSDIEEVSKGIIMTTDGKFMIVQRSDSNEWDAIGGHLMQGELAPYAFWRETKEETGLDVNNVQYLETRNTIWKKKNKLVHYFIGQIPHSCDELRGAISLQWELSDYFCGTIEEVQEKMSSTDGATQNLTNSLELLGNRREPIYEVEKFQQKTFKNHKKKKKRIVGMGKNTFTGAQGLKIDKNYEKSKSAPPGAPGGGWAPSLEEEVEPKKRKKLKIKIYSDLDEKKKRKKRRKGKKPGPKKGSKRKKRSNKYHWGVGSWYYGGGYGDSSDGGGDGGGGE